MVKMKLSIFAVIYLASQSSVDRQSLATVRTVMSGAAPLGGSDVERFLLK